LSRSHTAMTFVTYFSERMSSGEIAILSDSCAHADRLRRRPCYAASLRLTHRLPITRTSECRASVVDIMFERLFRPPARALFTASLPAKKKVRCNLLREGHMLSGAHICSAASRRSHVIDRPRSRTRAMRSWRLGGLATAYCSRPRAPARPHARAPGCPVALNVRCLSARQPSLAVVDAESATARRAADECQRRANRRPRPYASVVRG